MFQENDNQVGAQQLQGVVATRSSVSPSPGSSDQTRQPKPHETAHAGMVMLWYR